MCAIRLYWAGPTSPDQVATKWLLNQRGYSVMFAADLRNPKFWLNNGRTPTEREFKRLQTIMMVDAHAVVITDEMTMGEVLQLLRMGKFAGVRVIEYDALPAQSPCFSKIALLDELDLCAQLDREPLITRVRRVMDRWVNAFNTRCGWFFTNGNKMYRQAPSMSDPEVKAESFTTA